MPEATPSPDTGLSEYLGKQVVVDTDSQLIIVGTLVSADGHYVTLTDVDVHDATDSTSTKDNYIMESHKLGVRTNRGGAKVRLARVVCISLLDDIETW